MSLEQSALAPTQTLVLRKGRGGRSRDIEARLENARDKWRIHSWFGRLVTHQGIPVTTQSHESVDARLDTLR